MRITETCPQCGHRFTRYRNPVPAVDIIIELQSERLDQGLVLIERQKPPHGWALPGGFVEYGESLEEAAVREAKEETGLEVKLLGQFHCYSAPNRDPRQHVITTVFVACAVGIPRAASDAQALAIFSPEALPSPLAFDHDRILRDYLRVRQDWLSRCRGK
jgi:8-oxo-dGTP diphosphatase